MQNLRSPDKMRQRVKLFRDSVYYEIVHTFGVPKDLTDDQLKCHDIGEVINYSRFLHGRLLSHFLYLESSRREDDAFATHFGFHPSKLRLSEDERKQRAERVDVNKRLAHLTYSRVKASEKPWCTRWLEEDLPITIKFMTHIKGNPTLDTGENLFTHQRELEDWNKLLACLEQCKTGQRRLRFKSGFDETRTWYELETEPGSIWTLYGATPTDPPHDASIVRTPTNTTTSGFRIGGPQDSS